MGVIRDELYVAFRALTRISAVSADGATDPVGGTASSRNTS
jgi:hypothetical protein